MSFTVQFAEMYGYPRGGWDQGEFDAERRVMVAWTDLSTFLNELDTYPNFLYPYTDHGPATATAVRARVLPMGSSTAASGSSLASYDWAIVQLFHTTRGPQWDTTLGVRIHEELLPSGQYLPVARNRLRWTDGALVNPGDEPRMDCTLYEYVVNYSRLLTVPAWVLTRPGVCNSNTVTCQTIPIWFAPETLKYNGATIGVSWSLGRIKRYDVGARFLWKGSTWNKYWRPDGGTAGTGGWEAMKTAAGNSYIQHTPAVINVAPSV